MEGWPGPPAAPVLPTTWTGPGVGKAPDGRPDDATLWLKELGDKVFYGG